MSHECRQTYFALQQMLSIFYIFLKKYGLLDIYFLGEEIFGHVLTKGIV
jgi:hypothetical protein